MTQFHNEKQVFYGYSVGSPPTEPPRQDWPSVMFYLDCPRLLTHAFGSFAGLSTANQLLAGVSDRAAVTYNNQSLMTNALLGRTDLDYKWYLKPYFTHHQVYNPNNHPMWFKVEVFAPRKGVAPTTATASLITNFLLSMYQSCYAGQYDYDTDLQSGVNMIWKNVNTTMATVTGPNVLGLFPHDRTWYHKQKWVQLSRRKKVLIPAGATYKFRVFHRGLGPVERAVLLDPQQNPYVFTDRIVKVSAMSTVGMTPYSADATTDRVHHDFVTYGIWTHATVTAKCYVINKPVLIQSMSTAQRTTAVIDPSVQPQITVTQQVMGPNPA